MSHMLTRSLLVSEIMEILMKKGYSSKEAMKLYYSSPIADALYDEETGLYGQSAQYIAGLLLSDFKVQGLP